MKKYLEISSQPEEKKNISIVHTTSLIIAAQNLVAKLEAMYKHPDYKLAFDIASLYQHPYKGPSAINEMLVLKKELKALEKNA